MKKELFLDNKEVVKCEKMWKKNRAKQFFPVERFPTQFFVHAFWLNWLIDICLKI